MADDFGIDLRSPGDGSIALLEHEDGGALAHDETVPPGIERPRGVRRIVVAAAHRPDDAEGGEGERRERGLGSAREHYVGASVADGVKRFADGDGARRAAHGVRRVGAGESEFDRDVTARGSAKHGQRE